MTWGFIVKGSFSIAVTKCLADLRKKGVFWLTASRGFHRSHREGVAWEGSSHHGRPGSREWDGMWPEMMYPRGPASSDSTSPSRTCLQKFSVSPNITTSRGSSVRNVSDSHHSLLPRALKSSHKVHRVHSQRVPTALMVPVSFKCLESRDSWQSLSCESQKN